MTEPLRLLIVDDSPTDAKLLERELRPYHRELLFERVEDEDSMRRGLQTGAWDAIICDWSMPKFSAPKALRLVKELNLDIPFIIVSGAIGEETAVEAMRAGAHDYVLKDRLFRLAPALERELRERGSRSAHKRTQEALRRSEERFTKLAESGIIGIVVADVQGHILESNAAFAQMLGYTAEELLAAQLRLPALTPPEWRAADEVAHTRLRERGVATPWEKELFRKDGTRVPVVLGVTLLDHPECLYFVADLTERKQAQAALRQTEEQLRQVQKLDAIGSLAGGVAHDFNNLLSVILSFSTMLAENLPFGDPMRSDLDQIRIAGERAAQLTQQLLAFSRRQTLQPKVVNLGHIVTKMEGMLRRLIGEDIELTVLISPTLGQVLVDWSQTEQVVMNLVVNARDAMPRGGKVTIEIGNVELEEAYAAAHVGATAGPHVMLAISDTGEGMNKETLSRLFEPFFTTKETGRGTGLGLATVFGIVKQSGGNIWVYSEPGKGTTFKVYFPRTDSPPVDVPDAPERSRALARGHETVLLVEDDERLRLLARTILMRQGYHVLEASGGGDAIVISEQHPATIHLLLTDVVMPRMSGREVAKRVTSIRPDIKVLYMSGYTDNSIVHHGVLDSGIAFLEKPITPETLARKVREVLDAQVPKY